ncbi:MAG: hypothetical protein ACP5RF_00105 [Candidatus Micrarchaeia archaeon]
MEEMELGNKVYSYMIYVASAFAILFSLLFGSWMLSMLSSMLILASIVYMNAGNLLNNIILKKSHALVISNGYALSESMLSAFRKSGNEYLSISVAVLLVSNPTSSTHGDFESLLESIRVPFEFSIGLKEISKKNIIENLETRRRMKEIELSNIGKSDYKSASKLKREIALVENEIKSISSGNRPLSVFFKVKATSRSYSLSHAVGESERNAEHVASIFASTFNVNYSMLKGEELLDSIR